MLPHQLIIIAFCNAQNRPFFPLDECKHQLFDFEGKTSKQSIKIKLVSETLAPYKGDERVN